MTLTSINEFLDKKENFNEKASWEDADLATSDAQLSLERRKWKVKRTSKNSLKIIHDNGVVGTVTFDPNTKW